MRAKPDPLRVMVLTPLGENGAGGIDRVMDNLRHGLASRRTEVLTQFVTTRGAKIWMSPGFMARAAVLILVQAIGRRLDIVHINLSANASFHRKALLAGLCRLLKLPYVVHLHGSDFREYWSEAKPRHARAIDRLFREAAGIVLLGGVWRDFVVARLPEVAGRVTLIPNAVPARPAPARHERSGPVTVVFLGRLGDRKGSPQLLEALARMVDARTAWRAVLAGDGAVEETRAQAERLHLSQRVEVPGWVDPSQVDRLLQEADVLTLPSLAENLPMSVIEGMSAGLAVVTTPVGSTPEIIQDGVTGLLATPGDVDSLAAALRRTVEDAVLRRRLGEAALAFHREHLDIPSFVARLLAVWRASAERGGGRSHDFGSR